MSPGFFPQKVGANDDVKGVSVQHSAVLHHRFVAKTKRHMKTPQGMDTLPIPYSYCHSLSFPDGFNQVPGHYLECCADVKHCP